MSYRKNNCRGQMHIASGTTVDFTTNDVYQKIIGTWTNGLSNNFTVDDTNDRLTYTGLDSVVCLMNGVSDMSVDKACKVTYGLYKNGSLIAGAETPHDFDVLGKTSTIAISTLIDVAPNDYFEVWAKCDDATANLTINSLRIVFFGEK